MRKLLFTASAIALLGAPAFADNLSTVDISGSSSYNDVDVLQETGDPAFTQDSEVTLRTNATGSWVDVDQIGALGNATSRVTIGSAGGGSSPSGNDVQVLQKTNLRVISNARILGNSDANLVDVLQRNNIGPDARTESQVLVRGGSDANTILVRQVFGAGETTASIDLRGDLNDILVRQADSFAPLATVILDEANDNSVRLLQTDNNFAGVEGTIVIGDGATASDRNEARIQQTGHNIASTAMIDVVGSDNVLDVLQRDFTSNSTASVHVTGDNNQMTEANGRTIRQITTTGSSASITIEGNDNGGGITQNGVDSSSATINALSGSDGNLLVTLQTHGGFGNTSLIELVDSDGNAVSHEQKSGLGLEAQTWLTGSDDNTIGVRQEGSGLTGLHDSQIALDQSDWNGIDVVQEGGGQLSTIALLGSSDNLLNVGQYGSVNHSYLTLTGASHNTIGHDQNGTGFNATTTVANSAYNAVAVSQAQ